MLFSHPTNEASFSYGSHDPLTLHKPVLALPDKIQKVSLTYFTYFAEQLSPYSALYRRYSVILIVTRALAILRLSRSPVVLPVPTLGIGQGLNKWNWVSL